MSGETPVRYVVNIGHSVRIPVGEGREYKVGEMSIAVFRTRDGGVYATQASGPQNTGSLANSLVGRHRIASPSHGYSFDVRTGKGYGANCGSIRIYPAAVDPRGEIFVSLESAGPC